MDMRPKTLCEFLDLPMQSVLGGIRGLVMEVLGSAAVPPLPIVRDLEGAGGVLSVPPLF